MLVVVSLRLNTNEGGIYVGVWPPCKTLLLHKQCLLEQANFILILVFYGRCYEYVYRSIAVCKCRIQDCLVEK